MRFYVGVTDNGWFDFLARQAPDEVNFWRPSDTRGFRSIEPGAPFLFKLHSPRDCIAGGGFFVRHTTLPLYLAWECFGEKNGADSLEDFRQMIQRRRREPEPNPPIGCSILAEPFFWPEEQWIRPRAWARNIVRGKTYDTSEPDGRALWDQVQLRLAATAPANEALAAEAEAPYGRRYLTRHRLGQGAFRVLVTDAYDRRCSVTGERTLPVLEAAHIRPHSLNGPNQVSNGLLLRSDLHILFDAGYLTVTPQHHVEVSKRIQEEYHNGRDYLAMHGKKLLVLPQHREELPSADYLRWHNEHVFAS